MPVREQGPFIAVRAVQPVVAALDACGHPTADLLAACHIQRAVLDDPPS